MPRCQGAKPEKSRPVRRRLEPLGRGIHQHETYDSGTVTRSVEYLTIEPESTCSRIFLVRRIAKQRIEGGVERIFVHQLQRLQGR